MKIKTWNISDTSFQLDETGLKVEFEDSHHQIYTANQIAAEIYSSVDAEGYMTFIMKEIVDHDENINVFVKSDDMYFVNKDGKSH